nr:hypothetical protein [Tanacetum cinerariifolium]
MLKKWKRSKSRSCRRSKTKDAKHPRRRSYIRKKPRINVMFHGPLRKRLHCAKVKFVYLKIALRVMRERRGCFGLLFSSWRRRRGVSGGSSSTSSYGQRPSKEQNEILLSPDLRSNKKVKETLNLRYLEDKPNVQGLGQECVPTSHFPVSSIIAGGVITGNINSAEFGDPAASSRIILGWNPDVINLVIISFSDQVMHACIEFKADKKHLFCFIVYAHNRYIQRRKLWKNLSIHKHYVRDRPWCILGDFNVSLSADESSSGSYRIDTGMRNFQECVDMIKVTDVNSTGNIHDNVIKLRYELDEVQKSLDRDTSNVELRDEEDAYLKAFQDEIIDEERFLFQKAKIDWLKLGDANTAYFHKVPLAFINHYSTFLGQPGITDQLELNDLLPNRLSVRDTESMVRDVTNDEIKEALFSLRDNKAPGPDGFSAAFFKETWDIISDDVCKAIKEFFTNGILLKELNHTMIALILKVAAPLRVNDFRPISCCNVLFKCISKIISNHIKGSLADLVSPNQSAFVSGRRISDNILLTQELMHNYHVDRGPARYKFYYPFSTKDAANQEVKKDVSSLRYIALPNWVHDALLESSSSKPQDECSPEVPEGSRNTNPTTSTSNPLADQMETLTVETYSPTVSSPVPTACLNDYPEPLSDARLISKRVANQEETPSLDNILSVTNRFEDILGVESSPDEAIGVEADVNNMETTITASPTPILRIYKDHPKSQIIGPMDTPIQTRHKSKEEELLQFKIQDIWTLVDCPKGVRPIGTKWVLKNKKDKRGIVVRNKARLVAQGYTQKEVIDYDEVFAPVARIEAIRLFMAYASFMGFTVYQMDVKSAFLYGTINKEVYVMQPPGFQDPEFPAKVYKVEKAMGTIDQTLFIRRQRGDFILVQDKYVGDILKKFGYTDVRSSNTPMDKENPWGKDGTGKDIDSHLYRSMIGSLMYLTASRPDIMFAVCACARHQVTPKECHLHVVKRIFRYLKGHPKLGLWYPKESPFDLVAYSDSDYGGSAQDRKSTTRGSQFLGRKLISCAICIVKNPVYHSKTKHIEIRHHFIRDSFEKKLISVDHIHTDENVADLLTKPFDAGRFQYLAGEYTTDFHPMVDFIVASPLRYALTVKPTVFVSHIRQFWSTARIETTDEGTQILTTVDGIQRTVSESSLRRNLKLRDEDGISSLPDTELFENLTLMGPKSTGFNEFSSNIATALVYLATNRTYNFSKMIFDGMVKNLHNKISKFLIYPRFLTICLRMSQFGQITHTHQYVVPFHMKELFTTLRVNSPSFSGRIVSLFDTMLVHQGEDSGTPTEPHHTPSPEADPSYHTTSSMPPLSIPTAPIPPVTQPNITPIQQYTRRVRNAQSSALPTIADEPASLIRDVSEGEACPTESGFIVDQDRATIAKSSSLPHDSTLRVTSPAADEGSMQQTIFELTDLCTSLQRQHSELLAKFQAQEVEILKLKDRVKVLEDREGEDARQSRDDAPIKGRSIDEGDTATKRISDDSEELARVLTSMDAATVLAGGIDVPTG